MNVEEELMALRYELGALEARVVVLEGFKELEALQEQLRQSEAIVAQINTTTALPGDTEADAEAKGGSDD